ncbi:hypothetical protein OKA05_20885 [Luteolibacter arcticus]|uniref:Uncharacterized protein n=1 Tax=Luteolibacter arcticus TaxID=1581411 RepID=A0ABT3GNH0_9BACT|nr:hypothetical protein [Luteolibacter arcticus]MCW1925029.1 hypothetical protein [Luteolibacter arcticus]
MKTLDFAIILSAWLPLGLAAQGNLLRNGSFEGGTLYWHQVAPPDQALVKDAKVGEYALRIAKGNVMSAPFVAERGEMMTVSFFVKGEKPGRVGVQMPPSAREPGTKAKRLWMREAEQSAEIGTEWKRVSFTWPADVPADGFWPNPHYLLQIGGYDEPILIDGVTVTVGKEGTADYIPRREIEAVAECVNLTGWDGAAGNAFDKGATAQMVAHVSNPGAKPRELTMRWQFVDYEGVTMVGPALDKKITLAAGKTHSATQPMKLVPQGFIYARLSVLDEKGELLDKSDFPLTSIPYPKKSTKPDYRERFGGSFAGGKMMLEKYQRLGFGWTRWYPETKWHNFQTEKGAPFHWYEKEFDLAQSHGVSQHVVLYGWPPGLMDKEHSGQPLPLDMKWKADDPRWADLGIETAWDKFVKAAVLNFKGKSVIFEIENEPEFDKWESHHGEYAMFTIRTAKLIRATDPKAKIMVNNVYGVPSPVNAAFFKAGGLKYIDVVSWHDYHEGWLTDAQGIKRMKQNMEEAGGKHVELWFNEGWAYTNTAVDEPIACTNLTAAESTNAHACSVAEMTIAGQEKTILFHTGYEVHGQSFWDYSGPGTMLWDWYGFPLPLVAMWNVYNHHIGISDEVGFVRPPGANFTIFQDERNGKGVMIAYADRGTKSDVAVKLPDFGAKLVAEDIMGNWTAAQGTLVLSKTGRPVILYTDRKTDGTVFLTKLEPLDRKHAGFIVQAAGEAPKWTLPPAWEGKANGSSEGSSAMAEGKPLWKLEQLWPADMRKPENFKPMVWTGTDWNVKEGGFGGQPGANLKDGALLFGTRAPHGPDNDRHLRTAGLTFVAPQAGVYQLHGKATSRMWDSENKTTLHLLKRTSTGVEKVGAVTIPNGGEAPLEGKSAELAAGDQLTLLPQIDGMFAGGDAVLRDFSISLGDGKAIAAKPGFRLPMTWEGKQAGSADGNPLTANGKAVWRIDAIWPDDPVMVANYVPLKWDGTRWFSKELEAGGQPAVSVADGAVEFSVRAPWTGEPGQRTAALAFIAPESGTWRITGKATSKTWEGGAATYKLGVFKKDTQRSAQQAVIDLPRSGEAVDINVKVDLTAGHELVLVPLMPDWHNATNTRVTDLRIEKASE